MTVYKEGKYEVPILSSFPNNCNVALKRFIRLKQQLKIDPDLRENYKDTINTYNKKVYAKKFSTEGACKMLEKIWYLPHNPVFNKNKPEKFRMVFFVAAEYNGNSLNKGFLTGPDLLNYLVGVALQFFNYRVIFSTHMAKP